LDFVRHVGDFDPDKFNRLINRFVSVSDNIPFTAFSIVNVESNPKHF
jgi:hypothetical protein